MMVAATAPVDLRGMAYGIFNLISGIAMLLASAITGLLDNFGASFTFYAGAVFAALALTDLVILHARRQRRFSRVKQ